MVEFPPPPTRARLLEVERLAFAYPGKPVLDDVSLTVHAGEMENTIPPALITGTPGAQAHQRATTLLEELGIGHLEQPVRRLPVRR